MAKYTVNYTCGHTGTVELFGKTKLRYEKIEWMERNQVCPDCYREAKDAQRAAESKIAAEKNQEMPQLVGTPKQIAWAETIRAEIMRDAATWKANAQAATDPEQLIGAKAMLAVIADYESHVAASWWIEHRHNSLMLACEKAMIDAAKLAGIA